MTQRQLVGKADLGNGMVQVSHRPPLTINEQKLITARNVKAAKALIKSVGEYQTDPEKRERHVQEVCRGCYYLGTPRFPKQQKVEYECAICKDPVHGTLRDVPTLCEECAQKHSLCMLCGGDQDMRTARRQWADDNEGEAIVAAIVESESPPLSGIGGSLETKLSEGHGHAPADDTQENDGTLQHSEVGA